MSLSGWVFMVGFRVVDVALLGGWLFWFFRRVLDDDGEEDDGRWDGDTEPRPEPPPALPGSGPWPKRLRDHGDRVSRRRRARRERALTDVPRERDGAR